VTAPLLHERLTASAERDQHAPAVVDGDRNLTYGELEQRANGLAHVLVEHGISRGDRVGLFLEKSLESLVGIYGILKAGALYVPLDPAAPAARLGYIAADAGLRCLISSRAKAPVWEELLQAGAPLETVVALDAEEAVEAPEGLRVLGEHDLAGGTETPPRPAQTEDDLAYILYTSGSTGQPKGVMLSHRNALAFVDWGVREFQVAASDRLSSHAPLHFDLSIFDLYAASSAGAAVVLVPSEMSVFPLNLARFIADRRISVWYSVPSILTMLVLRGQLEEADLSALRMILFAGEVFPAKYLQQLMEILPEVRFANLYGPTETNVCTWYEVPHTSEAPPAIPVGRAIDDVSVFAVDEHGARVPSGEVGELCVTGPTVMHGYWNDAERTARSLSVERDGDAEARTYRTGDLARLEPSGDWLLLGRRDAQIKSRGYRIELGDIEAAINEHPSVIECAAVAVPDDVVTNRIKVFVSPDDVDEKELQRFCLERLPRYMVPEVWELRDELPKTSTGKIARSVLQEV
jgi:amino acid adenylation domain-containing protein